MTALSALTSEQVEVGGVEQLEAKQGENDLNRERAAVHKVPVEELSVGLRPETAAVDTHLQTGERPPNKGYVRVGVRR